MIITHMDVTIVFFLSTILGILLDRDWETPIRA